MSVDITLGDLMELPGKTSTSLESSMLKKLPLWMMMLLRQSIWFSKLTTLEMI